MNGTGCAADTDASGFGCFYIYGLQTDSMFCNSLEPISTIDYSGCQFIGAREDSIHFLECNEQFSLTISAPPNPIGDDFATSVSQFSEVFRESLAEDLEPISTRQRLSVMAALFSLLVFGEFIRAA